MNERTRQRGGCLKCWSMIRRRTSGSKWAILTAPATATPWVSCPRRQLTTVASKFVHPNIAHCGVGLKKIRKIKTKQKSHQNGLNNVKDLFVKDGLSFVCICVHLIICVGSGWWGAYSGTLFRAAHCDTGPVGAPGHLTRHSVGYQQCCREGRVLLLHSHIQTTDSRSA